MFERASLQSLQITALMENQRVENGGTTVFKSGANFFPILLFSVFYL